MHLGMSFCPCTLTCPIKNKFLEIRNNVEMAVIYKVQKHGLQHHASSHMIMEERGREGGREGGRKGEREEVTEKGEREKEGVYVMLILQ